MKIIEAVKVMANNSWKITDVIKGDSEYFFLYDGKYARSITKKNDELGLNLFYYPNATNTKSLAIDLNRNDTAFVRFGSDEYGGYDDFFKLYTAVEGKLYGIDEVMEDIIENDEFLPF